MKGNLSDFLLISSNYLIYDINLNIHSQLISLNCPFTTIAVLDLSNNSLLNRFSCHNTQLTTLDVSNNPLLDKLNCINNDLFSLNVQNGANTLLSGTYTNGGPIIPRFLADNNPNLSCIFVDDASYSTSNWTQIV
ncbi:MAG: hypothetical protein V3U80_02660 [Flavobacteriaceae bacterium]